MNTGKLKTAVGVAGILGGITALITAIGGASGLVSIISFFQKETPKPPSSYPSPIPSFLPGSHHHSIINQPKGKCSPIGNNNTVYCNENQDRSALPSPRMGQGLGLLPIPDYNPKPSDEILKTVFERLKRGRNGFTFLPDSDKTGLENNPKPSEVKLKKVVEGLQRGSNRFTLWLINETSNQSIEIGTRNLSISDNQGNTYEIDAFRSSMGLTKVVPPNGRIKLDYTLDNSIAKDANSVTFTLKHMWAEQKDSQFSNPLPSVEWNIPI